MCLSVPAQILSVEGDYATVSVGGTICRAGMQMIDNAVVGDYVLLHAGFAIQKISEKDAQETIELIKQMSNPDFREGMP
jgi:hydrogenase expression/formation protein HypC